MKLVASMAAIVALAILPGAALAKPKPPLYKATLTGSASQVLTGTEDITDQYSSNCDGAITETTHDTIAASFKTVTTGKGAFPLVLPRNAKMFPGALVEQLSHASAAAQDQINSTLTPHPFVSASNCPTSETRTTPCQVDNPKPDFGLLAATTKGPLSFYTDERDVFKGCSAESASGGFISFLPVATKLTLAKVRALHKGSSAKASGSFTKSKSFQTGTAPKFTVAVEATYSLKITRTR